MLALSLDAPGGLASRGIAPALSLVANGLPCSAGTTPNCGVELFSSALDDGGDALESGT
jgi:hypothetical protein